MLRIETSPTAELIFDLVPGLRHRVERALDEVFHTAVELRRLHGSSFRLDERFMSLRVGDYMVSYLLDIDSRTAKVMLLEPLERATGIG